MRHIVRDDMVNSRVREKNMEIGNIVIRCNQK